MSEDKQFDKNEPLNTRAARALEVALILFEADSRLWPTADKTIKPLIAELRAAPSAERCVMCDSPDIERGRTITHCRACGTNSADNLQSCHALIDSLKAQLRSGPPRSRIILRHFATGTGPAQA